MTINTSIVDNRKALAPTVYVRASWSDAWQEVPNLYVASFSRACAPTIGEASLIWQYGRIEDEDGHVEDVPRAAFNRYFVKIVQPVHSGPDNDGNLLPITWYGVIVSDTDQRFGHAPAPSGNQTLRAIAMEWILTRQFIDGAMIQTEAGPAPIYRGLTFNGGIGTESDSRRRKFGNRHSTAVIGPVYVFGDPALEIEWSAGDMLAYLLYYFAPQIDGLTWRMTFPTYETLVALRPVNVETHGRTFYEILNQLIDRRNGMTWSLSITGEDEQFADIRSHTIFVDPITLPSTSVVAANDVVEDWDPDEESEVAELIVATDTLAQWEQLSFEGAPRTSTLTVSYGGESLVDGWTVADEIAYVAGANATTGDIATQKYLNDTARQRSRFDGVFTWHVVKMADAAETECNGWVFADPTFIVCPMLDADGAVTETGVPMYVGAARFLSHTPLPDVSTEAWTPLFSFGKVTDQWEYLHRLSEANNHEKDKRHAVDWSCRNTPLHDRWGVAVQPSQMNHVMGRIPSFNGAPPSNTKPQVYWREVVNITATAECMDMCRVLYPPEPAAELNGMTSRLVIPLRGSGRLDYVAPGTIVTLTDGEPVAHEGGFIRDDRPWMRDLAAIAWEFHRKPRRSLHATLRQITNAFSLGMILSDIGAEHEPLNGLLSRIEWNVLQQETSVYTDYGELDVLSLAAVTGSMNSSLGIT